MRFSHGNAKTADKLMTSALCRSYWLFLIFREKKGVNFMLTSLAFILLSGLLFGYVIERLHLPRLLGMILAGMLLSPHAFHLLDESMMSIAADLRQLALVIIFGIL